VLPAHLDFSEERRMTFKTTLDSVGLALIIGLQGCLSNLVYEKTRHITAVFAVYTTIQFMLPFTYFFLATTTDFLSAAKWKTYLPVLMASVGIPAVIILIIVPTLRIAFLCPMVLILLWMFSKGLSWFSFVPGIKLHYMAGAVMAGIALQIGIVNGLSRITGTARQLVLMFLPCLVVGTDFVMEHLVFRATDEMATGVAATVVCVARSLVDVGFDMDNLLYIFVRYSIDMYGNFVVHNCP
jgi:hypothetical protein